MFKKFTEVLQCFALQVEVSAGRGRPSMIIDKDESLEKVNFLSRQSVASQTVFEFMLQFYTIHLLYLMSFR